MTHTGAKAETVELPIRAIDCTAIIKAKPPANQTAANWSQSRRWKEESATKASSTNEKERERSNISLLEAIKNGKRRGISRINYWSAQHSPIMSKMEGMNEGERERVRGSMIKWGKCISFRTLNHIKEKSLAISQALYSRTHTHTLNISSKFHEYQHTHKRSFFYLNVWYDEWLSPALLCVHPSICSVKMKEYVFLIQCRRTKLIHGAVSKHFTF